MYALRVQTGAAYSAALYLSARPIVRKVEVLVPHDDPTKRLNMLFWADSLARMALTCWLFVYIFTLKYECFMRMATTTMQKMG